MAANTENHSKAQVYMDDYKFIKFKSPEDETRYLYCMNCGPEAGVSYELIWTIFSEFGEVENIFPAGDNGTRVFVVFVEAPSAAAAKKTLDQRPCERAGGKVMRILFSDVKEKPKESYMAVMMNAEEMNLPGLTFYPEFVTIEEEEALLSSVDQSPWDELTKRRVQHYGFAFNYKKRSVDPESRLGDLPSFTKSVVSRIESLPELVTSNDSCIPLDQLTVNEYTRGVGLSPHIDIHSAFGGCVVSLSLGGPCIMQFRRAKIPSMSKNLPENNESEDLENDEEYNRKALFLPPRSLLVLMGEARYAWSHYIPHHRLDIVNGVKIQRGRRVSFTFRKIRRNPCSCTFLSDCDDESRSEPSQQTSIKDEIATKLVEVARTNSEEEGDHRTKDESLPEVNESWVPPDIEKTYVHKVYDAIAPHFSSTRFAKWPKVASFLHSLDPGSLVLDAGCGNGKYLGLNPNCFFLGCDISSSLVGICKKLGFEVSVGDALSLPYRDNTFDAGISIAVLHHLSNEQRRKRAIAELMRVVKTGERALFTVWAREQENTSLIAKWTPLLGNHTEKWMDGALIERSTGSNIPLNLESIQEVPLEGNTTNSASPDEMPEGHVRTEKEELEGDEGQQEYFVPWHLPYHRAEINGASALAVSSGLAKRDDKKSAVVYNRYYHVFFKGELEGLVEQVKGLKVVESFYDKSNWCVIVEKTTKLVS